MVVQSLGSLTDYSSAWWPTLTYGSLSMYDGFNQAYAYLYRTQPNVRVCVDFLARNVAQLGLHTFQRVGETDRRRLRDHPLAEIIGRPNPYTTRYRLIESLLSDLGVYFNAYWLKLEKNGQKALLRIPPELVLVQGYLVPTRYDVSLVSQMLYLDPDRIVHFRGYNAESAIQGLSPLETLRRVLAEEHAMGDYREYYWRNAARMNGVIERPREAPDWSETARERFKAEFEALYSGTVNSGKTAILEEGMTWKAASFSARDSEYLLSRKLTREECARSYHIPLPMVGILDNATFSNIKEQHKNLYQDCLGPWLKMIEDEIELQLLPWVDDGTKNVYVEFNIQEKLAGSFEEQATAFQTAVGRPWMAPDEARARINLPSMGGDAAELGVPLNMTVGDQPPPAPPASTPPAEGEPTPIDETEGDPKTLRLKAASEGEEGSIDATLPTVRARHVAKWAEVLRKYFTRQEAALIGRVSDQSTLETVWIDGARWDAELGQDLLALSTATALVFAKYVLDQLDQELDEARMARYLQETSRISAEEINQATYKRLAAALLAEIPRDAVKDLFEEARTTQAERTAVSKVTQMANFGAHEGASQGGLKWKTWHSNSMNPREAHVAMSGQKVRIGTRFSNGMLWPGDPAGGAENNAHCECSMSFSRDE